MFDFFVNKKEIAAEVLSLIEPYLRESLSSMENSLNEKLAGLEKQQQQNLRHERRRQTALESIFENQNIILRILEKQEMSPPLEALISLAENFALTRLAEPVTPESDILYNKLTDLMNCFDLTLVSERGVRFDPERHEACGARCVPYQQDGLVLEIVRPGFLLRDKVLRYATVVVNRHDYGNPAPDGGDVS